jgi:hypoxanthine phosphoribosyltransferase
MVIAKPIYTVQQIQAKVAELGERISRDYEGKDLLVVAILKGAFLFAADLVKQIRIPMSVDFIVASSYVRESTTGEVAIHCDVRESLAGRHVLLVEDIVDTGTTLNHIHGMFSGRSPASIRVCGLLNKKTRRRHDIKVDYAGFEIPDIYVVGYGLDYENRFRNLPYIAEFRKSREENE